MGIFKKLFSRGSGEEASKATSNTTASSKENAEDVSPVVARLQAHVKDYLDSKGWSYYTFSRGDFLLNMALNNDLQRCELRIMSIDEGIRTIAKAPINVPSEERAAMVEFVTRANYGLVDGAFEFDWETGTIQYSTFLFDSKDPLALEVVANSVNMPLLMFEVFGNAIVKTANGIGTPRENVKEVER